MVERAPWRTSIQNDSDRSAAQRQYHTLLDELQSLAGFGVWTYDIADESLYWSPHATAVHPIAGVDRPTLSALLEQYHHQDRDTIASGVSKAVEDGASFTVDVALAGSGTTERLIRLSCAPQVENGETSALFGTVEDVTATKRREQRIEILRRTNQTLRTASSKDDVASVLASAAKNILGLVNTTVRLVSDDGTTLEAVVATEECVQRAGDRPDYEIAESTPAARTFRTGEPEIHSDHDRTDDDHSRGELRSGLYVPIGDHGVLSAGDVVVDAFESHDLEAAGLLGQLGAEAITRIGWVHRSRAI
ncbi:GAF domain-containing protein [Halocatena halophila]|uniref:GAF domain-containing protein n=1 Tax=Halocatena halophila TaxID=2814576 RepID=UPI002ED07B92